MTNDESPLFSGIVPIPEIFYSENTHAPFAHCLECDRRLLENGAEYIIEKAVRRYPGFEVKDTVFEYALCMSCTQILGQQFSKISRQRLESYFQEYVEPEIERRIQLLLEKPYVNSDGWLGECVVKRTPINTLEEYQIVGHFKGKSMIVSLFPYIIGGEALNEIGALLSNETVDFMDDFSGKHFGVPPEFSDLPKFVPIF